jgi:NMD protein affecting ribosome stability and mRNA decay
MLTLHPTLGVNAHLTFCRRCGGDAGELMLIGNRPNVYRCDRCETTIFGHRQSDPCPKCGRKFSFTFVRKIEENERLPASGLCDKCDKEVKEYAQIVADGGVYFRCFAGHTGVVKAGAPLSIAVRQQSGIEAPNPVGVEVEADQCPACRGEKEI